MLNEAGGHAGNDLQHAAVRRWVAPRDGVVRIISRLNHSTQNGDGVRGRIVSSRSGELAHREVHNSEAKDELDSIAVQKGDTIDFIADCYKTVDSDSFDWKATISFAGDQQMASKGELTWDSEKDFSPSLRLQQKPLTEWEKYAQVLLLADEFVFVD
jgi:hypothetical protein